MEIEITFSLLRHHITDTKRKKNLLPFPILESKLNLPSKSLFSYKQINHCYTNNFQTLYFTLIIATIGLIPIIYQILNTLQIDTPVNILK